MFQHLQTLKYGRDRKTHMLVYKYLQTNQGTHATKDIAKNVKRSETITLLVLRTLEEAGIVVRSDMKKLEDGWWLSVHGWELKR